MRQGRNTAQFLPPHQPPNQTIPDAPGKPHHKNSTSSFFNSDSASAVRTIPIGRAPFRTSASRERTASSIQASRQTLNSLASDGDHGDSSGSFWGHRPYLTEPKCPVRSVGRRQQSRTVAFYDALSSTPSGAFGALPATLSGTLTSTTSGEFGALPGTISGTLSGTPSGHIPTLLTPFNPSLIRFQGSLDWGLERRVHRCRWMLRDQD